MSQDVAPEDHSDEENTEPEPPQLPPRNDAEQAQEDADEVPTP